MSLRLTPITRKRLARFRRFRRAYWSWWILLVTFVLSLGSELICGSTPILVRFEGSWYIPLLRYYPDDLFTGSGRPTRPDYKEVAQHPAFKDHQDNYMIFPLHPFGPYESVEAASIASDHAVTVVLQPAPRLGTVNVDQAFIIAQNQRAGFFFGVADNDVRGLELTAHWSLPPAIRQAIDDRFNNRAAEDIAVRLTSNGGLAAEFSLSTFTPRSRPPRSVRLTMRELADPAAAVRLRVETDGQIRGTPPPLWAQLSPAQQEAVLAKAALRQNEPVSTELLTIGDGAYETAYQRDDVYFPYAPVSGHPLGLDSSGRDVLARILYGYRVSMSFGLLLVTFSIALGMFFGAIQGYYGGRTDIIGQRLIEIWSALPFLYIMILMGSVFGRSFTLFLVCYSVFNWIGISYYVRAEFLRLRGLPFVEAARCMGTPASKIIFRHILPNSLGPVITLLPFMLVGAIGVLTALDYLGYGLPPPTPSWGEFLSQAQEFGWAWWLILFPSLALFAVMLLVVFVGEGLRSAFDPKRYSRMA